MINWHKCCAIFLSHEAHPTWHPHSAFKWINKGVSTKYLVFQIGFNTPRETMILTVIHIIQQKLIHWSSKKLSLAGRIRVENQLTPNNMVQLIILENLQGEYTPNSTTSTQLHLVW